MKKLFTPLSRGQRLGWYFSSIVFGLAVVMTPAWLGPHDTSGDEVFAFKVGLLAMCWLVGVLGLRIYIQDKDPTDFKSILGLKPPTDKK